MPLSEMIDADLLERNAQVVLRADELPYLVDEVADLPNRGVRVLYSSGDSVEYAPGDRVAVVIAPGEYEESITAARPHESREQKTKQPPNFDAPTVHELARALAAQLHPRATPRDVTVMFAARRMAPLEYRDRSRGGSVTAFAQELHATLYGLPAHDESLPAALDALLQATHSTNTPEQETAILRQVSEQLRNAAEIIKRYQYQAQWEPSPSQVAEQLADAHDRIQQAAQALDHAALALNYRPTPRTTSNAQSPGATTTATALPSPGARRR